ncbi:LytR/AlgR family response regulator transcription factor [Chitinophaga solisilvae]|uniref:LytR/AlgR family response regulator transcription factor n=1 Tax=Chitinophaga solisilvae TaxID=1233460 RepID=UPI001371083F|nr:LytTR family DNA-binding domain-containing protein [Chitinophaga solisilvae]
MMRNSSNHLSILIVDDETEACRNLKNLLLTFVDPCLHIDMAHNTQEAGQLIDSLRPDAVFLDIDMPGENAFSFLERIPIPDFEIVFVTAYDEYAIRAFRLNAIDYLLKPVNIQELTDAVKKLRERVSYKQLPDKNRQQYSELAKQATPGARQHQIILKDKNRWEVVDFRDILYVEAQTSYSRIYFLKRGAAEHIMMSHSIATYEELLPAALFYRIHKSYLVNCLHLKQIEIADAPMVVIHESFRLPIGRRRYTGFRSFLQMNSFADE